MTGTPVLPKDSVDAAIAAADKPAPPRMQQVALKIDSTGRPAVLLLPEGVTEAEVVEVAGWMLTVLLGSIRAAAAGPARPRLYVPRRV